MQTKYCTRCGSILESGAAFCSECGARVTDPTDVEGYGYTAPDSQPQSAVPADPSSISAEDTSAASGSAQQSSGEKEFSYYQNSKDGTTPDSSGWQSADPFSNAPETQPLQDDPQQVQSSFQDWQNTGSASQGNTGWQQNPGGFQQMNGPVPSQPGSHKTLILVLGVVAIVFAVLLPIVTYPSAIVGLVLASKAKKAGENVRNGQVLCIIGLVLAILNSALGVLLNVIAVISDLGFYY